MVLVAVSQSSDLNGFLALALVDSSFITDRGNQERGTSALCNVMSKLIET
jgi:hypothetical protein